ncbi:hypothetical protein K1719_041693 [Acacia pycnantha]|nr:hypothetical protein K1719_041693 [Acacia pycnantha]
MIARIEIIEMQNSFDAQLKEHSNAATHCPGKTDLLRSKTKNLQLSEWSVITQKLNERTIYNKYMSFRTYSRKRKAADGIAGTSMYT